MKRTQITAALVTLVCAFGAQARAAGPASPTQQFVGKLHWRSIGPFIGGRVVAVAGVPGNQNLFYFGGVQGGIWKSTDYGQNWTNISDRKIPGVADPIGALAVAPSNPNVIYAGTGEADIRSDFDTGDGIYRTTNAGKSWSYAGLRETHMIAKIVVDPRDPNIAYAASMGHVFRPNAQRGIFKTTDGGRSWRNVLFVNDATGGVDLVMDPHDRNVLYAAMWQAQRVPWKLTSGGPGSGLFKTTDGGAHWRNVAKNPGFARGPLGKIGVAVAATNPRIVYAIAQAREGGVFRSADGGATWRRVNSQDDLRQRAFYYTAIFADPTNAQTVFAPEVDGLYKSTDGGRTFDVLELPHGDDHIIWINPHDHDIILEGDDGGATVTVDGGKHWSSEQNQPTGQYYHVALDDEFPFDVYGAAQDEGAYEGPSAAWGGAIGPGEWHNVALGESTFVAPEPGSPMVTYGSGYYSSMARLDRGTAQIKNVSPWPRYMAGNPASQTKYRFGWTHPIFFSPADPRELLTAAQVVFSSMDHGKTWRVISPDLTRNDPSTEGPSGGDITYDQTGAETYPDIASLAVSPLDAGVMWAGSADGLVHVTTNHGADWKAVTPPLLPQWAQITSIEPSHTDKGTAYLTASRYMWDDYRPYLYETTDYGGHWSPLVNGLPADQYLFAVRQDPREPNLLFAGTRATVYASFNGGALWQPLTLDLPGVQVRDLAVNAREGELVAATHGRAFWILDNLSLLEQLARTPDAAADRAAIFTPETAWLSQTYGAASFSIPNFGENPRYGARVFFKLPANYNGRTPLTLAFLDANGATIRTFNLHYLAKPRKPLKPAEEELLDAAAQRQHDLDEATAIKPGMNAFQWDMRYPPAYDVPGWRTVPTDDFPDTGDGPTILPGSYTAVLQYGAQKYAARFEVRLDPRVRSSAADLLARFNLELQIRDAIDRLDRAVAGAMTARNKLDLAARPALDGELAQLVQMNVHSSEADVLHQTEIREQLGFLLNSLENAYQRPTAAEYAAYNELEASASAGEARLHDLTRSK